jgi:hypothetical protein
VTNTDGAQTLFDRVLVAAPLEIFEEVKKKKKMKEPIFFIFFFIFFCCQKKKMRILKHFGISGIVVNATKHAHRRRRCGKNKLERFPHARKAFTFVLCFWPNDSMLP